ncbi:MAG: glycerol-3-phosphate acyltransferase [Candidatus Lokiarchaeota archaeon]|nr:glycerol-3-phosphate acyltransferase [Candidatus Lokiarchaeota archaeon]
MADFTILVNIFVIVIGYFIGSINPAYIFGRFKKFNIRDKGYGIAGTINAYHVLGVKYAILTGIFDFFKGIIVIYLALILGADFVFAQISGLAAIVGHVFPFYIKFRGGQGMACTSGILLAYLLNYLLTGPEMIIFIFVYLIFIIAIFFFVTKTGIIVAIITLGLIGYAAFIYYPGNPYNFFFLIVVAYDISVSLYDTIKGKLIKIEDENFKAHWWRVATRPFAFLFIFFYMIFTQIVALLIIGIVAIVFIVLDMARFLNKQTNELFTVKFKSIFRKNEAKKFSSMTIFLVATFISILLFEKNIAITALTFLIFGDIFSKIFGLAFGRHKIFQKTLEGTLAYFGCVLICGFVLYNILEINLFIIIIGGITAPLVELFSFQLNDNFTGSLISGSVMTVARVFGI